MSNKPKTTAKRPLEFPNQGKVVSKARERAQELQNAIVTCMRQQNAGDAQLVEAEKRVAQLRNALVEVRSNRQANYLAYRNLVEVVGLESEFPLEFKVEGDKVLPLTPADVAPAVEAEPATEAAEKENVGDTPSEG